MAKAEDAKVMKQYLTFSYGSFLDKNDNSEKRECRILKVKDEEKEVCGRFYGSVTGKIYDIYIQETQLDKGGSFKTLKVNIEDEIVLSFSFNKTMPSFIVQQLVQIIPKIDFSKDVQFIAYQKNGYNKLSVKQDGTHVENAYFDFVDNKNVRKNTKKNDFPNYAEFDDKDEFKLAVGKWIEAKLEKLEIEKPEKDLIDAAKADVKEEKVVYADGDINPEDIPF